MHDPTINKTIDMKFKILTLFAMSAALSGTSYAASVYNIDIDAGGTTDVKAGYTRLESPFTGSGGSVTIDGDTFTLVGQAGSRARSTGGAGNSDGVNRDFAFIESGGGGVELGMQLGGLGALEAGTWSLSVYSWDSDVPIVGQTLGIYTDDGVNPILTTIYSENNVDKSSTGPAATFNFVSDGTSAYQLFIRDDASSASAAQNKIRFNGIDLVLIPEPSSIGLVGLGSLLLLARRRR